MAWDEPEPGVRILVVLALCEEPDRVDMQRVELHPNADFGMLLALLKKQTGPVQCVVTSPNTVAHLVCP